MNISPMMAEMGFQPDPPICLSCRHYRVKLLSEIQIVRPSQVNETTAFCGLGCFVTRKTAVCDKWEGENGDLFEVYTL